MKSQIVASQKGCYMASSNGKNEIVPATIQLNDIRGLIFTIRDRQVILDYDLAMLYQVETGALNRAMKRNKNRFPEDFCFQLTEEEFLRCQNGISKDENIAGRGGRRYMPYIILVHPLKTPGKSALEYLFWRIVNWLRNCLLG